MGTVSHLPEVLFGTRPDVDVEQLRTQLTCTVETAGAALGISRGSAYAAVRAGQIPSLRLGNRIVVPVPKLLELVGVAAETSD